MSDWNDKSSVIGIVRKVLITRPYDTSGQAIGLPIDDEVRDVAKSEVIAYAKTKFDWIREFANRTSKCFDAEIEHDHEDPDGGTQCKKCKMQNPYTVHAATKCCESETEGNEHGTTRCKSCKQEDPDLLTNES